MLQKKKRVRRKSPDEFDPEKFTGKHTLNSRLGDVGWFFKNQWEDASRLISRARRLSSEIYNDLLSKLRS